VPVLAIASHIPSAEIGSTYFQETHPQELFRECSVYTELVGDPRSCRGCSRSRCAPRSKSAVSRSSSCPATCSSPTPRPPPTAPIGGTPVGRAALRHRLAAAADVLNDAKKVTILAGRRRRGAHDEVVALAETLQAPIVHALRGKEHIEWDNPYDVG
jgi:pyruvate dehydrogenase (quinone)